MLKRKKSHVDLTTRRDEDEGCEMVKAFSDEGEECEIVKAFIDLTLEQQNNDGKKQSPLDALLDGRRTERVEPLDEHLEISQEKPMTDAELADVAKLARKKQLEMKAAFHREQAESKRRRMQAEADQAAIMQRDMQGLKQKLLYERVDDATIYQYWCHFKASIFRDRRHKHHRGHWGAHVVCLDEDERWNFGTFLASVQHEYMAGCCKNCFNSMAFNDLLKRHDRSGRMPMVLRSTKLFFKDLDERRKRKPSLPLAPRQIWLTCAEFGTWTWL